MDVKEFLTTVIRECKKNKSCKKCPFYDKLCIHYSYFDYFTEEREDEVIAIAEKLNHKRTYADDFFEKFPNAPKENDGEPIPCRDSVYGAKSAFCVGKKCRDCWNEPMPEEETK